MKVRAIDVRKAVFKAVPEYKPLHRINCSVLRNGGLISLHIGLLSPEATSTFDKVGTLDQTWKKILNEVQKLYPGKKVGLGKFTNKNAPVSMWHGKNRYSHGLYYEVE